MIIRLKKGGCKSQAHVWDLNRRGHYYSILVKYQVFAFSSFVQMFECSWIWKIVLTLTSQNCWHWWHHHHHVLMICTCCLFLWVPPVVTASPYGKNALVSSGAAVIYGETPLVFRKLKETYTSYLNFQFLELYSQLFLTFLCLFFLSRLPVSINLHLHFLWCDPCEGTLHTLYLCIK